MGWLSATLVAALGVLEPVACVSHGCVLSGASESHNGGCAMGD